MFFEPDPEEIEEQKHKELAKQKAALHQKETTLMQLRAVTSFIVLSKDSTTWEEKIVTAANFDSTVAEAVMQAGYTVQTLRIVTNPFGEYLNTSSEEAILADMKLLSSILAGSSMPKIRIRFAIGAAVTEEELLLVPVLIKEYGDLANVCVNIGVDQLGVPDQKMCGAAAVCVRTLADHTTDGEGNFNFTANFNCPPLIPYFPAGYNTNKSVLCLGLEYPDLLVSILKQQPAPIDWSEAFKIMQSTVQKHVDVIVDVAKQISDEHKVEFAGLDSSPSPRKDISSMCEVFSLLGAEFGSPGTLKACAYLTRLFKSVTGVPLIGFSGLMLTCLEDSGMAESAAKGAYNITMLNAYSAVCGIGLDCVPIPGDTDTSQIAALMSDTGTLAFRLNKPLTVRLFPCPGLKAGDMTKFASADLCNCTVFAV